MSICSSECSTLPPRPTNKACGTKVTRRPGGVSRLVFAACNVRFDNIQDPAEWCDKVSKGEIVATAQVVGQKPKASFTSTRIGSCSPEAVTGAERSITFMDFNRDEAYADYDFWNEFQRNPELYRFGYVTCEGLFHGFIDNITVEVDEVIEDNSNGSAMWDGTVKWQSQDLNKPVKIAGLESLLDAACDNVPGYDPCSIEEIDAFGTVLCGPDPLLLSVPFYLGAEYQWRRDAVPIVGAVENEYEANEAGSYTVVIRRSGANCTAVETSPVVITSNRPTIDSVDVATPEQIIVTASGGSGSLLYQVINSAGIPSPWQPGGTFTGLDAGTYTVAVQDENLCEARTEAVVIAA